MAPMSQEQFRKAMLKMRDRHARIILWKLGEMQKKYAACPRTQRACKELRAARQALEAFATEADPAARAAPTSRRTARRTGRASRVPPRVGKQQIEIRSD
jgi:hypothetical protein